MNDFIYKKSLGQNFLTDLNVLKRIVNSVPIEKNSLVIEIGPGSGNLTKELANVANQVLCYEIDSRLELVLDENLKDYKNVEVIFEDFLKSDIKEDLKNFNYDNLYLVANLPYYITTPIIEKVINSKLNFKYITVMVQKEVGERFNAKPGMREYNSLTVYLNYYFDIKREFIVSRNSFTPKPNVDSMVISLIKKEKLLYLKSEEHFDNLIRDAFRFKRKNIRNNLKNYDLEKIENVLKKYNYDLTVRAEDLSLEIFVDISNSLS